MHATGFREACRVRIWERVNGLATLGWQSAGFRVTLSTSEDCQCVSWSGYSVLELR